MTPRIPKAHLALVGAGVMWGLMAPIGKMAMSAGISGLSLATMRMVGAAVLFWLASLLAPRQKVTRRDLGLLFLAGLLSIVCNQGLYIIGLSLTSPVDATLITTSMPILTMILAALFLREPITATKGIGVLVGAVGAVVLIWNSQSGSGESNLLGNVMCLVAQTSFACYLTLFRGLISRYHVMTLMKWMFTYATFCYLPFAWGDLSDVFARDFPMEVWLQVGYVVLFGTFFTYILVMVGQKSLRPTVVSMYNYVQPVVGACASVAVGVGVFGWSEGLAAILICTGVYVVTQSKSRAQLEAARKRP